MELTEVRDDVRTVLAECQHMPSGLWLTPAIETYRGKLHDALDRLAAWADATPRTDAPAIVRARPFVLMRHDDETGLSGTGLVAWGCAFPDGKVVTRWCGTTTDVRQTCVWDDLEHVRAVHGHDGKTSIIWTDDGTEA